MVREGNLIHWEITFKHTSVCTKMINAVFKIGSHIAGQFVRAYRNLSFMPVKSGSGHADATQFNNNIWTFRNLGGSIFPFFYHLLPFIRIGSIHHQATNMVKYYGQIG